MTLPAHLQNLQTPDIGGVLSANLGSAMPPHVSIEGNRFTLIDASNNEIPVPTFDPVIGVYLDAAIIDVNAVMSRIYFASNYDKAAKGTRPDCFSDNGVGPSISASSPQASTCAACPRSEWTKVNANGNKVPWCTHKQKIALLIPGFDVLFMLAVPPNSHGPMREYVERCKGNGVNMANLITRMSFISQGTLQFAPMSYIDAPTAELRQKAYVEKKTDVLVGRNDVARGPGSIGVSAPQQIAAPSAEFLAQQMQRPASQMLIPDPRYQETVTRPAIPQQVQQPGPFVPTPAATVGNPGWPAQSTVPTAAATSPSEQPATGRRRRRTTAEMQAANPSSPAATPGTVAPQALFPHPSANIAAQQVPVQTDMGFGMSQGQPAAGNPELTAMLDDFFTKD